MSPSTLILGRGPSAHAIAGWLRAHGMDCVCSSRDPARVQEDCAAGIPCVLLQLDSKVPGDSPLGQPANRILEAPTQPPLRHYFERVETLIVTASLTRPEDAGSLNLLPRTLDGLRPRHLIYLSSAGVYRGYPVATLPDHSASKEQTPLGEDAPLSDAPRAKARLGVETRLSELAQAIGARYTLFRMGALYGPARGLHKSLQAGRIRLWGGGQQRLSRLHVEDLASAVGSGLLQAQAGVFNLADLWPASLLETSTYLCERLGLALPDLAPLEAAPATLQRSRPISSALFRDSTNWVPKYPSYREGFVQLLQEAQKGPGCHR